MSWILLKVEHCRRSSQRWFWLSAGSVARRNCVTSILCVAREPAFTHARSAGRKLKAGPNEQPRSRTLHASGHWIGRQSARPALWSRHCGPGFRQYTLRGFGTRLQSTRLGTAKSTPSTRWPHPVSVSRGRISSFTRPQSPVRCAKQRSFGQISKRSSSVRQFVPCKDWAGDRSTFWRKKSFVAVQHGNAH